jgi:hypothetical protein
MDRNYIVELIKSNRLQDALKLMEKASEGTPVHNEVIILSASYADYARLNRSATQDYQTLDIQRAKITNSLLSILDELSPEDLADVQVPKPKPQPEHTAYKPEPEYKAAEAAPAPSIFKNKMLVYGIGGALAMLLVLLIFVGGSDETSSSTPAATQATDAPNNASNENTNPLSVNELNAITAVEYDQSNGDVGYFLQEGRYLVEGNDKIGDGFKFKEIMRQDGIIYLHDDSRHMTLFLDLNNKVVNIKPDNGDEAKLLYHILNFSRE